MPLSPALLKVSCTVGAHKSNRKPALAQSSELTGRQAVWTRTRSDGEEDGRGHAAYIVIQSLVIQLLQLGLVVSELDSIQHLREQKD